jgi:hypothetical protein
MESDMKKGVAFAATLCAIAIGGSGCAAAEPPAQFSAGVAVEGSHPLGPDVEVFYDDLGPYGEWSWDDPYGWIWIPRQVPFGWRPYTMGNWDWTDDGWTWHSDYPWGWACFHYGRWFFDVDLGWAWVPGNVWAPAWVAWNYGDRYYGWAPLPPRVAWESGPDWDDVIPAHRWVFVDRDDFLRARLSDHLLPLARNETLLHLTRNHTRFELQGHHVISRSLPLERVEGDLGHPVRRYRIVELHSASEARQFHAEGDQVAMIRPSFAERRGQHRPPMVSARGPEGRHEEAARPPGSEEQQMRNLSRRQAGERQRFYDYQRQQREALQRSHDREWKQRPEGLSSRQLFERQMSENRALNEQMQREGHVFEHQREREFRETFPGGGREAGRGPERRGGGTERQPEGGRGSGHGR